MRFALGIPNLREFADVDAVLDIARDTERGGWDALFIWEVLALPRDVPMVDPLVALAGVAAVTSRIRFGPLVTAPPRRRPQKLAREAVTLDHLSHGRFVLGVAIGSPNDFTPFGEDESPRVRAERLDESLEIITRLWSGERVSFEGRHHVVRDVRFLPGPVQSPRIPIWVGGMWPNRPPLRRAARWDGFFPISPGWPKELLLPEHYREIAAEIRAIRGGLDGFDLAFTSTPRRDRPAPSPERVAEYAAAGVTWWIEEPGSVADARGLAAAGPPRA